MPNRTKLLLDKSLHYAGVVLAAAIALGMPGPCRGAADRGRPEVKVTFAASIHPQPVTGRLLVIFTKNEQREPRFQIGRAFTTPPVFAVDVNQLKPDAEAVIDEHSLGLPLGKLSDLPPGDYFVQALLNVYTEVHRSDGHAIWVHLDHWEGQDMARSPGNLYSTVLTVHITSGSLLRLKVALTQVIPAIAVPPDTAWVKHIKMQSKLLTQFWGCPIYIGATLLLPKGYADHPGVRYPVLYYQDHFRIEAPFGFRTEPSSDPGEQDGYKFHEAWTSADFPRLIVVTFQHPTPYSDDSYAVNSANNGPYGDALMTELIPYIEEHFRVSREPYARVLTGLSTGGWEALALQVYHPEFFGGSWVFCPDPVDFRRYNLANVYKDDNAFYEPGHEWLRPLRYIHRAPDGQPQDTAQLYSLNDAVLGSHDRSEGQLATWEAVYGPVGEDGYPQPLWDKLTGVIDHPVAIYMRDHGYDLRYYIETHWPQIGPSLVGKLHFYCGDMDGVYLNLAVYLLEDFLKTTKNPYYAGSFEYGRPLKGHGWMPMTFPELIRTMAEEVSRHAPEGQDTRAWHYQ